MGFIGDRLQLNKDNPPEPKQDEGPASSLVVPGSHFEDANLAHIAAKATREVSADLDRVTVLLASDRPDRFLMALAHIQDVGAALAHAAVLMYPDGEAPKLEGGAVPPSDDLPSWG